MQSWRSTADVSTLKKRANIVALIRSFFAQREILEVETPIVSRATVSDPFLESLKTSFRSLNESERQNLFLQTSPEYAMKRLLASGSGDIYQISKAFRDDEVGNLHNPEFTMLEWYRIDFKMQDLVDEVKVLLEQVLQTKQINQFTYAEAFTTYCGFNPLDISHADLVEYARKLGFNDYIRSLQSQSAEQGFIKDSLFQLLFATQIEEKISQAYPVVITHFPATQASLACLSEDTRTAERFEVYFKGIELANGFEELTDPIEQLSRFERDNEKRESLGLETKPIDHLLISALENGLPKCAGVALGIDRLIMLALGKNCIREVLSFNYENC